jgi:hypothetical protein
VQSSEFKLQYQKQKQQKTKPMGWSDRENILRIEIIQR